MSLRPTYEELEQQVKDLQGEVANCRQVEEAHRKSEERFRRYFELGLIGMANTSPTKGIVEVNDEICQILGYDRGELLQKNWAELTHPDDLAADVAQFNRVLSGEIEGYAIDKRFIRKDRQVIDASISVRAMRRADGSVECFLGLLQDITQRKRAEDALKASEEKYRHLVKYAPTGIYEVDFVNKRLKSANKVMCQVLGYTEEEFLCMDPFDLLDDDGKRTLSERIMKSLAGEKVDEAVEYKIVAKDGHQFWSVLNNTFTYEDGRITGALVVAHDITERKKTEQALRRSEQRYKTLSTELEFRVKERTAELERRNCELQEFAFISSHDLSEPLRKIESFGSLLSGKDSENLSEVQKDYITRMTGAANRMKELLDALLRYSRVESKGQDFKLMRLNDVARDAAGDLEVAIQNIGVRVEIGLLPTIKGDPYQWRQVFQNLIANAVKYHRSEVKPFIKIYGEECDGACHIFVEDNGIGFDEKYLDKIFQPFQRLHGKHEYSGTGIGLAICQKIVERHGGRITARSTPGKGSTFIVTLPLSQVKEGS